ncbi:MAG: TolC family protein [Calditrichaeota bacterium]|jgi:outer membrane protein|nr:TolC family protein [Calditrichota bacterium]MBT7615871.1 TolC family protein [Calditrichota bacterium]MBT7787289.1 TolC family protein [Calditrichota bacterium]
MIIKSINSKSVKKLLRLARHYRLVFGLILCIYLIAAPSLMASDTLKITLEDALFLGFQQSPAMRTARLDSLSAEGEWKASRGGRLPQLKFYQDAPSLRESVDEQFVYDPETGREQLDYVPSGDLRWQSRLDLNQDLPWGGTLSLSSRIYKRDWYWTIFESKEEYTEYSLLHRVMFDQPLLEGNPVKREFEISKIDYSTGMIDYEISLRDLKYNVTQAFLGLVSAEGALEIAAFDLELGQSSETLAERKLGAGLIPEVELLQIQVDLARRKGSHKQSENTVESTREQLKLMLGLDLDQPIRVVFDVNQIQDVKIEDLDLSGERLETKRGRLNLDKSKMQTKASVLKERVNAYLQAYYELDSRRDEFEDISTTGDKNFGVSLHLEIPIFGFGTTSGRLQTIRASQKRNELQQKTREAAAISDIRGALRNVETASDRIKISNAAVALSVKSHAITEDRFENGNINSRELLDSQLELTRMKREALNAQIDYELAVAYLVRIAP